MDKTLFLSELNGLETKNKDVITLYNEISALAVRCAFLL